jgi:glycine oxidase
MKDYLIVGNGLAGIFFSNLLLKHKKDICVISDHSQNSTEIAGGLYNPVVLKRFTMAWEAHNQSQNLLNDYQELEILLKNQFIFPINLYRKLTSIEEQNNWTVASDQAILENYLDPTIIANKDINLNVPFGFGKVNHTGFVDTNNLKKKYEHYLKEHNIFIKKTFNYQDLKVNENHFLYHDETYKNIVFCEGFGLHQNIFFNYLPLDGTKGELLLIKSEKLNLNQIINSSIFVLPLGNHLYKIGATYNWKEKNNIPTEQSKNELINQLKELINCEFEIIEHHAGIRPTVNDRKPLLGEHPIIKNMYILNGLGTRGVMLSPYLSKILFNFIENKIVLPKEIDIKRYQKLQNYT